jgi:hypothetical protein
MATNAPKISKKAPIQYLQSIVDNEMLPDAVRADAAKALLPYTAKKTSETLETVNRNYHISDERLKALTDDELNQLFTLLKKCSVTGDSGDGDTEEEVQHD